MDAKMELKRGLLLMLGLLCFFWGKANERQSIWPEGTNIGSLIWNGMKSLIRP